MNAIQSRSIISRISFAIAKGYISRLYDNMSQIEEFDRETCIDTKDVLYYFEELLDYWYANLFSDQMIDFIELQDVLSELHENISQRIMSIESPEEQPSTQNTPAKL